MKRTICRILGFILLCCVLKGQNVRAADTETKDEWKNGIVEINAGVTDPDGKFHVLKHTSGFLVTNSEQNVYIITRRNGVSISTQEKNDWMQKNGFSEATSSYAVNTSVRVIVKGDVSSEVTILNQSENENFVILKSESVIQEKSCLKIGNTDEMADGETVYSMGFPEALSKNSNAEYVQDEVSVQEGKIDSLSSAADGMTYITHQSRIDGGEMGGPVVDETGYVIGLNQKIDEESGIVYALPIENVKDILDSYGIEYGSKKLDQAYKKLQKAYDRGTQMLGERYQKKSLKKIEAELETAKSILESNTYEIETITSESDKMEKIMNQATPKMPRIQLAVIGMAGFIMIMGIYLIIISIKERKLLSKDENRIEQSNVHKSQQKEYQFSSSIQQAEERAPFIQHKTAVLQRIRTGEEIVLGDGRLTLGKSVNQADYVIQGNKTISRVHAEIRKIGEGYQIIDRASSNGTFVNGKRVSQEGIKLRNQDKIRLSNEEFIFKEM